MVKGTVGKIRKKNVSRGKTEEMKRQGEGGTDGKIRRMKRIERC